MAKRKTKTRSKSGAVIVRPRVTVASPTVTRARALARRASPYAKRGLTKAKKLAMAEKHTLVAVGGSAALAVAESKGMLEKLPTFGPVDQKGIIALGAFALSKLTKNPTVAHLATGMLSVATFETVKKYMGGLSGYPMMGAYPMGYETMGYDDDDDDMDY